MPRRRIDEPTVQLARAVEALARSFLRPLDDEEDIPEYEPDLPGGGGGPDIDFDTLNRPIVPVTAEGYLESLRLGADDLRVDLTLQPPAPAPAGDPAPAGETDQPAAAISTAGLSGVWYFMLDEHLSAQMLVLAHCRDAIVHGKRVVLNGRTWPHGGDAVLDDITLYGN